MASQCANQEESTRETTSENLISILEDALNEGVLLEMLIAQAVIKLKVTPTATNIGLYNIQQLKHSDSTSDIIWFLNIVRKWSDQIKIGNSKKWCSQYFITDETLERIEHTVQDMYKSLQNFIHQLPKLRFNDRITIANKKISELFIKYHGNDICVYMGHTKAGYQMLKTKERLAITQGTMLHVRFNKPEFILCLQHDGGNVAAAMILPEIEVDNLIQKYFNTTASAVIKEEQLIATHFDSVGSNVQQIVKHMWCCQKLRKQYFGAELDFKNETFLLETDEIESRLTLYCRRFWMEKLKSAIYVAISEAMLMVRGESFNMPYPQPYSQTILSFGAGLKVREILTRGETRLIAIRSLIENKQIMEQEIYSKFEDSSESICKATGDDSEHGIWGYVCFKTSKQATVAIERVIPEHFTMEPYIGQPSVIAQHPVEVSQDISYSFDPIVLPTFKEEQLTASAKRKNGCKRNNSKKRKSTEIVEENMPHTEPSQKAGLVKKIHSKLYYKLRDVSPGKFHLNLILGASKPKQTHISFRITFLDYKSSVRGMECLLGEKINGCILSPYVDGLKQQLCTFHIKLIPPIHKVCRKLIIQKVDNLKLNYKLSFTENVSTESCLFEIVTSDPYKVEELKQKFENMLEPQTVNFKKTDIVILKTETGRNYCNFIELQMCCHIYFGVESCHVYGSKLTKSKVSEEIGKYITYHGEFTSDYSPWILDCKKNLKYEVVPSLAKCDLVNNNFNRLLWNAENGYIVVDASNSFEGPTDIFGMEIDVDQDYLFECLGINFDTSGTLASTYEPCSTCYGEMANSYILEGCGHVYCIDCMTTQVKVAIKETKLPLECACDGVPFTYRDYINICAKGINKSKPILKAAIRTFLTSNAQSYKCCPKVNCDGILRVIPKASSYSCLFCGYRMCSKCLQASHSGMSCAEYQDVMGNILVWMKENVENRKECPNCGMGIEKNGGCNNVFCCNCKTNICWKCLSYFKTNTECYDHLRKDHGGIYEH